MSPASATLQRPVFSRKEEELESAKLTPEQIQHLIETRGLLNYLQARYPRTFLTSSGQVNNTGFLIFGLERHCSVNGSKVAVKQLAAEMGISPATVRNYLVKANAALYQVFGISFERTVNDHGDDFVHYTTAQDCAGWMQKIENRLKGDFVKAGQALQSAERLGIVLDPATKSLVDQVQNFGQQRQLMMGFDD